MGAPSALLKQMHHLDEGVLQAIYGRLSKLAQAASDLQVKLLVDAEHTFYQPVRVCVCACVCTFVCMRMHMHVAACGRGRNACRIPGASTAQEGTLWKSN